MVIRSSTFLHQVELGLLFLKLANYKARVEIDNYFYIRKFKIKSFSYHFKIKHDFYYNNPLLAIGLKKKVIRVK